MASYAKAYRGSDWSGRHAGSKHVSIAGAKTWIRQLPITVAHNVAKRAAPVLTTAALRSYDSGQTVYGDPRPRGVDGKELSLDRTGATKRTVRFVTSGTIIRCALGTKYARYLIGKYGILPNGRATIPAKWSTSLAEIVATELAAA